MFSYIRAQRTLLLTFQGNDWLGEPLTEHELSMNREARGDMQSMSVKPRG